MTSDFTKYSLKAGHRNNIHKSQEIKEAASVLIQSQIEEICSKNNIFQMKHMSYLELFIKQNLVSSPYPSCPLRFAKKYFNTLEKIN